MYHGQMIKNGKYGKVHGYGTLFRWNPDIMTNYDFWEHHKETKPIYIGEWKDGQRDGFGISFSKMGGISYVGDWKNGQK